MSTRWRMLGVLAHHRVGWSTACSTGTRSQRAPHPPRHRRPQPRRRAASAAAASRRRRRPRRPRRSTIDWWHITTGDPGKADFQAIADAYTAAHPEREDQHHGPGERGVQDQARDHDPGAATYPDLFQSWGGGTMAAQADAGLLKDITADVASWKDTINPGAMSIYQYNGKQYGMPWDMGMIGFWYNKELFAKAGITAPPATWDDYLADVDEAQGRRHRPARDRRQGQVAVHAPVDVPRPPHRRRRRARSRWSRPATGTPTPARRPARTSWRSTRSTRTRPATRARPTTTRPPRSATARPPWS